MHLVTSSQMQEIDSRTIEGGLVPGFELMERAGKGIFDLIERRFKGQLAGRRMVCVCGKGNNGGDGLVIARHLIKAGVELQVYVLAGDMNLPPSARQALHKLIPLHPNLTKFADPDAIRRFPEDLEGAELIVDALFGIGINSKLREPALGIVRSMNRHSSKIISVDLPSGLSGDLEPDRRETVRAAVTATIGLPKIGLYYYPAREAAGEIETVDIGFPSSVIAEMGIKRCLVDREVASSLVPRFDPASHKYKRGSVLLVSGSRQYGGAALLTVGAALRSGVGMVYAAVPESLRPMVQSRFPSAICIGLAEDRDGYISREALPVLIESASRADAVALGPGLGRRPEISDLLRTWLPDLTVPTVLDADALMAWPGGMDELNSHPAIRVLTPHSGELGTLLGITATDIEKDRGGVLEGARRDNLVLLHKGAPSEVIGPDGQLHTIAGGDPAMARGGTGDILTGILGALTAQAPDRVLEMTLLGAWLHAEAGRLGGIKWGRGLNSADIQDLIPAAWRLIDGGADPL
jgi:ADP-dependent NAD(P)H-hydrate dehydratase / NAD(P)H-hydrate epimerase